MFTTIATSITGALLLAGILSAIKSRWLYVIAPKLYLKTPLSDGEVISLTIHNAGLLAEEDVAITLRPACKFEIVATSKSTLSVSGKTISIPKLSRQESVTLLILVEGKAFEYSDIDSVESKHTKGKIVETKEKATALWHSFVILPILAAVLLVPFAFGTVIGAEMQTSALGYINQKFEFFGQSKQLAGYKSNVTEKYEILAGDLKGALKDGKIEVNVTEIVRRSDTLTIAINLKNNSKRVLIVDAQVKGASGGRGPLDWSDSQQEGITLSPGESKNFPLKAYVPENEPVKLVQGTYNVKTPEGSELTIGQIITFP